MRKNQRKELFLSYLTTILYEGGENNFVIFTDIESKRFVQFAGSRGDRLLIVDIPKVALNKEERKTLQRIFVLFEEMENSFQGEVTPEQGSLVAEKLFRDVFLSSDSYSVAAELTLE
jgi:hypothetical protein